MRTILLSCILLFLAFQSVLSGQHRSITVTVTNTSVSEPIAFANVWLKGLNTGAATDVNGVASISIPQGVISDTLVCTFIGYDRQTLPVHFEQASTINVVLTPTYTLLSEITITPDRSDNIDAKQLIKEALKKKNIKRNYSTDQQNILVGYQEIIEEDGAYITFNEAIANVIYDGYPLRVSHKRGFRNYYSPENRQSNYSKRDHNKEKESLLSWNCQFFRYYVEPKEKCYIIQARHSDNHSAHGLSVIMAGGPIEVLTMDKVKYRYDMLDPKVVDKYIYTVANTLIIDGNEVYVISFKPILDKSTKKFGYRNRVNDALLAGTIYLNKEDIAITKFEAQLYASTVYNDGRSWQEFGQSNSVVVEYKKSLDEKYHIDKIVTIQQYSSDRYESSYQVTRQLNVLDIGAEFKDYNVIAESKLGHFSHHLRNVITPPYDRQDWTTYQKFENYSQLTADMLSDLSRSGSLEEQFFRNSIK